MYFKKSIMVGLVVSSFIVATSAEARFLSTDPIKFDPNNPEPAMFNRYSYGFNDPVNMIDPFGKTPCGGMSAGSGACNPANITRGTEVNTSTNTNGSETDARQQVETNQVNDQTTKTTTGSITRQPQASNSNAPAVVSDDMQEQLLNFSEDVGENIDVNSGLRTAAQNSAVGGATNSSHLSTNNAQAADISISGKTAAQTADAAHSSGEFNRVNEYTNGQGVHVDLNAAGNQGRFRDWTHVPDP